MEYHEKINRSRNENNLTYKHKKRVTVLIFDLTSPNFDEADPDGFTMI